MFERGRTEFNVEARMNQPPILWIRFFGFLGSGFGLGWFIRAATNSAKTGAASVAAALIIMLTIGSQLALAIYLFLRKANFTSTFPGV